MGGSRRLLHDVAELAGDGQVSLARIRGRLDEEDVSADGRDGQPGGNAWVGGALADLAREAPWPEPLAHLLLVDSDLRLPAFCDLTGGLAAQVGDPALEVANAGLACVLARDQLQRVVGDHHLFRIEA